MEIKNSRNIIADNIPDLRYIFLFFSGCLGLYLNWHPIQIIVFLLAIWAIFASPSGRQIAVWAFVFFVLMSLSIVLKKSDLTDQFSLGAMLFFFISVIKMTMTKTEEED